MTLDEIWADRPDMTRCAHRVSAALSVYVSLANKSPDSLELNEEDRNATDWEVVDVLDGLVVGG